jgi:hypothetical protein
LLQEYTWPTPSGITEQQARDNCSNYLLAKVSSRGCLDNIANLNIEDIVQGCVEDFQVWGTVE